MQGQVLGEDRHQGLAAYVRLERVSLNWSQGKIATLQNLIGRERWGILPNWSRLSLNWSLYPEKPGPANRDLDKKDGVDNLAALANRDLEKRKMWCPLLLDVCFPDPQSILASPIKLQRASLGI